MQCTASVLPAVSPPTFQPSHTLWYAVIPTRPSHPARLVPEPLPGRKEERPGPSTAAARRAVGRFLAAEHRCPCMSLWCCRFAACECLGVVQLQRPPPFLRLYPTAHTPSCEKCERWSKGRGSNIMSEPRTTAPRRAPRAVPSAEAKLCCVLYPPGTISRCNSTDSYCAAPPRTQMVHAHAHGRGHENWSAVTCRSASERVRTTPHRTAPRRTAPRRAAPHRRAATRYGSHHTTSHHITLHHATPHHTAPRHTTWHRARSPTATNRQRPRKPP